MSRYRVFSETEDVLQAAVRRLHHIYETHDSVAVAFSGGKDSLVTLHLARLVGADYGVTRIPTIFRDEEVITPDILEFVDRYRQESWVDMRWYCYPLQSDRHVLGENLPVVFWDTNRAWLREPPSWALRLPPEDTRVFSQFTMDEEAAKGLPGKVCVLTGVRARESPYRMRSVLQSTQRPWMVDTDSKRVMMGRPIYDWEQDDVWKFLLDQSITPCPVYDAQLLAGQPLRVSTPLHAGAAKHLSTLRASHPEHLERLFAGFPGTDIQERYRLDIDRSGEYAPYEQEGLDGVERWIDEHITDKDISAKAHKVLRYVRSNKSRRPLGYPTGYILREFAGGGWRRGRILPLKLDEAARYAP